MNKETLKSVGKTALVTLAGAGEGALIGAQFSIATAGASIPVGAVAGGATALTAELAFRARAAKKAAEPQPEQAPQPQVGPEPITT